MEQFWGVDGGAIVMPQLPVTELLAETPELSTTMAVKLKEPEVVGVPVMAPVDVFKDRPGGKVPELMEKV